MTELATTDPQEFHFTLDINASSALDYLANQTPLSKQQLKQAAEKGAIWLKAGKPHSKFRRLRRLKGAINKGSELSVYYNTKVLNSPCQPSQVLEQFEHYSVCFKPSGVFCEGSKWADHSCITRQIEKQLQKSCYLVHRLDRATSGLMLIAHTKLAARLLSELFANRHIEKTYRALVVGQLDIQKGHLDLDNPIDNKKALSRIRAIKSVSLDNDTRAHTLLEIDLLTGRKHQIRKHLSGLGYPIVGDRLYGSAQAEEVDLQLCAYQLSFSCPPEIAPHQKTPLEKNSDTNGSMRINRQSFNIKNYSSIVSTQHRLLIS